MIVRSDKEVKEKGGELVGEMMKGGGVDRIALIKGMIDALQWVQGIKADLP